MDTMSLPWNSKGFTQTTNPQQLNNILYAQTTSLKLCIDPFGTYETVYVENVEACLFTRYGTFDLGFCRKGLFCRTASCCENAGGQSCPLGCGPLWAEPQTKTQQVEYTWHTNI